MHTQAKDRPLGPVIFDLQGTQLSSQDKSILEHPLIGGIILFTRNYESPEQVIDLIKSIRSVREQALIFVDQEGGRVQ